MIAGSNPPSLVKSRSILPPNAGRRSRHNKKARWLLPRQRANECESKCATQASADTVVPRDVDGDRDVSRKASSRNKLYKSRLCASSAAVPLAPPISAKTGRVLTSPEVTSRRRSRHVFSIYPRHFFTRG